MTDEPCVLVLTTLPATADAAAFGRALVAERLAACVSVSGDMRSYYRWEGQVAEEGERQILIKTTAARLPALEARLCELHPYDVPEFLVLPVGAGSDAYLAWVRASTAV